VDALITTVRGQKVLLDSDLALLYGVPTFRFNEAVKRNQDRFPVDFRFQLTAEEWATVRMARSSDATSATTPRLKSRFAISSSSPANPAQTPPLGAGHGGRRKLPWAFTEHGAMMAANILNSPRAVEMSIYVIRAFVKLRAELARHHDLAGRLAEIESTLIGHDAALRDLYSKIRPLLLPAPEPKRREIGFHVNPDAGGQARKRKP